MPDATSAEVERAISQVQDSASGNGHRAFENRMIEKEPANQTLLEAANFASSLIPDWFSRSGGKTRDFRAIVREDGTASARDAGGLAGASIYHVLFAFSQICALKARGETGETHDAELVFLSDALLGGNFTLKAKKEFERVDFAPAWYFERSVGYGNLLAKRISELKAEIAALGVNGPIEIDRLSKQAAKLEERIRFGTGLASGFKTIEELEHARKEAAWLRKGIEEYGGRKSELEKAIAGVDAILSNPALRNPERCEGMLQSDRDFGQALRKHAVAALGFVRGPAAQRAAELVAWRLMDEPIVRGAAEGAVINLGQVARKAVEGVLTDAKGLKAVHRVDDIGVLLEKIAPEISANGHHAGAKWGMLSFIRFRRPANYSNGNGTAKGSQKPMVAAKV